MSTRGKFFVSGDHYPLFGWSVAIMSSIVASLVQQCQFYILMHLEEFPIDYLSLLPLATREALLWQLPIADICQLQDTKFAEGLEAVVVDCLLSRCDTYVGTADEDGDVERYIENRWKNTMAYAREILYGQLVTSLLGCLPRDFGFEVPTDGRFKFQPIYGNHNLITDFLCCIRKEYKSLQMSTYSFPVPPRYIYNSHHQHAPGLSTLDIDNGRGYSIYALEQLIRYFNGKHPKVLGGVCAVECHFVPHDDVFLKKLLLILGKVEQLGFEFEHNHIAAEFIATTVSNAKHLEVLVLKGSGDCNWGTGCIDMLCDKLSFCTNFWSTFRIFKILSHYAFPEYVISRSTFDELIKVYFAAPTDHEQLVQFTDTTIEGDGSDHSPDISTTYLKFKKVRLENCRFVTTLNITCTPDAVANWLGREVDVLENEADSCTFHVKESGGKRGQKRKYSEDY